MPVDSGGMLAAVDIYAVKAIRPPVSLDGLFSTQNNLFRWLFVLICLLKQEGPHSSFFVSHPI